MVFSHRHQTLERVHPNIMVVHLAHNFPAMGVFHHKCLGHHHRGPSSSQQYYRPEIPFNVSEEGFQYVEVEDTDDESESLPPPPQPERRPRRLTRRPPCSTGSHR